MATATKITSCAVSSCAFNSDNGCNALAITVVGDGQAACGTKTTIDARAAVAGNAGQVGACHRLECTFNKDLMCTNASISIVGDEANCSEYAVA